MSVYARGFIFIVKTNYNLRLNSIFKSKLSLIIKILDL